MPGFKVDSMGEIVFCSVENVSVMDVYDLAMDIGKECESLITVVGSDSANSLIKKVIVALELLERFANKNDQENSALAEMACRIEQLEAEKEKKAESRHKFEKEVETVEDQWRNESRELLELVNRLQEENKRLTLQEDGKPIGSSSSKTTNEGGTGRFAEMEKIQTILRKEIESQKNEMNRREEEINQQQEEIVNLQLQVENLKSTNIDSKRLQRELQGQIRTLCGERTNLITRIQDQHTEIVALKRPSGGSVPAVSVTAGQSSISESALAKDQQEPETIDKSAKNDKSNDDVESSTAAADEVAPVQGPMPYEPDDAPWKRRRDSESGIRKFFRQLFLEADKAPFTNRTFGSLSRM